MRGNGGSNVSEMIINRLDRTLVLRAGEECSHGITERARREAANADPVLRSDIFRVWVPVERPRDRTRRDDHDRDAGYLDRRYVDDLGAPQSEDVTIELPGNEIKPFNCALPDDRR